MMPDQWLRGEVAVVGLARSGEAVVRLLRAHKARVYASDAADSPALQHNAEALRAVGAAVDVGRHDLERIAGASCVIVSPGVPSDAVAVTAARSRGVPVVSEVAVALSFLPALRYIGVTGTNGKSTVTAVVAHLLKGLGVTAPSQITRPVAVKAKSIGAAGAVKRPSPPVRSPRS